MADARVVVVGAGIGGLVAALLLAREGVQVRVIEAAVAPGGKMRRIMVGDRAIDSGPTVLTMRWIFEHIFEQCSARLEDRVAMSPLQVLARHAWGQDEQRDRLDLHADAARNVDAIGRFAGAAEARRFAAFRDEAQAVYRTLEGPYIRSAKPGVPGMIAALGPGGLARLTALGPLSTLSNLLARRFTHARLRQLFARYATYCGASPWLAPSTLMLIAAVEMQGVWSVEGGMHALALAVEDLARERGVEFDYGSTVDEIVVDGGRARGVRTADGRQWPADAVVFNGDADALPQGLLGGAVRGAVVRRRMQDRSLSALTMSLVARTEGMELARHNVFFDDDYASEFDDICRADRLPRRGTVYLCAQDRDDSLRAVAGSGPASGEQAGERLFMLVNAPAHGDRRPADALEIERCELTSQALLQRCGLKIHADPRTQAPGVRTTPQDFHRLFPASGGSLYGTATHGWMALFRRPGSTTRVPGLFLAGGSVHPGPGVPMAAMSGLRAAEALMAHLASTSRSSRVATFGGTSTRSATTAETA